jgi:hypothetical protein
MRRKSASLAIALFVLSAACAAQKPQQKLATSDVKYSTPGQAKPKGVMRCHMEQETGSNRMERVCSYVEVKGEAGDTTIDDAMIQAERRAAQHMSPPIGGGGR